MRRLFIGWLVLVLVVSAPAVAVNSGEAPNNGSGDIWFIDGTEISTYGTLDGTETGAVTANDYGDNILPSENGFYIIANETNNKVIAYDPSDDTKVWENSTRALTSDIDMARNSRYIVTLVAENAADEYELQALHSGNGTVAWSLTSAGSSWDTGPAQVAVTEDYVVQVGLAGRIRTIAMNGTVVASSDLSDGNIRALTADDEFMYFVDESAASTNCIRKYGIANHTLVDTGPCPGREQTGLVASTTSEMPYLIIEANEGRVYNIKKSDMSQLWVTNYGSTQFVWTDGEQVYHHNGNYLAGLDMSTGTEIWNVTKPTGMGAVALDYGADDTAPDDLELDIETFMEHGTTQDYTVLYTVEGSEDVTDSATVTSGDTNVITVDTLNNRLLATENTSVSTEVTITAEYNGLTTTETVTVSNKSIDNLEKLPPETWPSALLGGGGAGGPLGDTTGGNDVWPGAVQLQLIFLAISIGATVGWITGGNPWASLGAAQIILIGGWVMDYAADGFIIASLFAAAFLALTVSEVTLGGR